MQALLLGGILGGGYYLSTSGKNSRKSSISNKVFKEPSQNSIYSSTYTNTVSDKERELAKKKFEDSKDPVNKNVISNNLS